MEHIARRKQIWQALHPADAVPEWEKGELEVEPVIPLQDGKAKGSHGGSRPHPKDFAASTAELTGGAESQRAKVAAKLANMAEGRPKKNSANLQSYEPVSQSRAAELLNVGTRTWPTGTPN